MTQREFDGLPGLLSRAQFLAVTGLTDWKFRELKRDRVLREYRNGGKGYSRYYKAQAGEIGGWKT